jgi:hypothetical protein
MWLIVAPEQIPIAAPSGQLRPALLKSVPTQQLPHPLTVLVLQALPLIQGSLISRVLTDGPNLALQLPAQTIMPGIVLVAGTWARW